MRKKIGDLTLEIKLKDIADSEAGKWIVDIGHERGVLPATVRTVIADKHTYENVEI